MKNHSLWCEKYRPQTLNEFVGSEEIKEKLQRYLEEGDIQNLLFYGPAGCGKTSLAKLLVKKLDCDYIYINSSDERGIDTIREKVQGFASAATFKKLKVVILDEADFMTINSQTSLRNTIETFSKSTRFILTGNYVERIIDPLQSRCLALKIVPPDRVEIAQHLQGILNKENIQHHTPDIATVVTKFYPDLRKCINTLQLNSKSGELVLDKATLISNDYVKQVLRKMMDKNPSFKEIRQIIADSSQNTFGELYKELYLHSDKYLPGQEGSVAIIVNEHQFKAQFSVDQEICIMSCIANIINLKN